MWIYLARHAETLGNIARIVQKPSTPLSTLGPHQANAFAKVYANTNITKILCSDYERAQQTALPLADALGVSLTLKPMLRERDFGDLRGLAYDDIDADFFAQDYKPANGEAYPQFVERIQKVWGELVELAKQQSEHEHLLVMTHGLVVRCVLSEILKLPESILSTIDVKNTCVTKINCHDLSDMPLLCDTSHLDIHSVALSSNLGAV
ncbi:histidine phosphatase family protein [Glaciecola sp. MH2013]|uniref:histidine phosphatase family protein n=1 Tax=Glaciecola sp. MH2013 TaxID=2785524 RepID=UPI0018A09911|nr:histidine phosphatase family protein [Glaciecola sp. MH2013]MBF7073890.1 histidine phosphatase family protein [Glaciecola sp. MH2013]